MESFKTYVSGVKTYIIIIVSVVILMVIVGGGYWYTKGKPVVKESVVKSTTTTIEGQVVRTFEGENKIIYSFDAPENATSTTGMDGALVKVLDGTAPYVSMYFSYEGGRGYMPLDYIKNVIVPRVAAITITGTTTIGSYVWTVATSDQSEWHVAQVGDGQWLLVVESKKALHDKVLETLKSLSAK